MISIVAITPDNLGRYLEDIAAIERASFPSPWHERAFHDEAGNDVSHLWVLVRDGITAAYICFWMFFDEIHLLNLAVAPGMRRMGLARRLLEEMIASGVRFGAEKVWLEVRPSNAPARGLYAAFGFSRTGRRPQYYSDTREDALIMSLPLAGERCPAKRIDTRSV